MSKRTRKAAWLAAAAATVSATMTKMAKRLTIPGMKLLSSAL